MFDVPDFLLGFLAGVVMAMLLNLSVPYRHFRERRKLEAENKAGAEQAEGCPAGRG